MMTNAIRIVDEAKVPYRLAEYEVDETDLSAPTVAAKIGMPTGQVFKTLALRGDKTGVVLALIAADAELDIKALAQASGNKHCEMLALKEVQPVTGYIRGGVSPLGTKKRFPVYVDETAQLSDEIAFSAGVRGTQLVMTPDALIALTDGVYVDIARS